MKPAKNHPWRVFHGTKEQKKRQESKEKTTTPPLHSRLVRK